MKFYFLERIWSCQLWLKIWSQKQRGSISLGQNGLLYKAKLIWVFSRALGFRNFPLQIVRIGIICSSGRLFSHLRAERRWRSGSTGTSLVHNPLACSQVIPTPLPPHPSQLSQHRVRTVPRCSTAPVCPAGNSLLTILRCSTAPPTYRDKIKTRYHYL